MENLFLEAVKIVNPIQLILIGLIIFYFYNRLDNKIETAKKEIKQDSKEFETRVNMELKTLNQRIDSLYQLIVSVFKNAA